MPDGITIVRAAHPGMRALYNGICEETGILYRPLSDIAFDRIFRQKDRLTLCVAGNEELCGFLSAHMPAEKGAPAYLSYIGVAPGMRRRGIASELLSAAVAILRDEYGASRIDTVFYDPAHLPWTIPGSRDGHPCAPGTQSGSAAESLLLNRGFGEWCAQIAYYLPLSEYKEPKTLESRRIALESEGIVITTYDENRHRGLYELFDAIRNPGWRSTVFAHLDRPIIVAVDTVRNGLVVGYTGPLSQDPEGDGIRGNFCGIGTHPEYRGRGIGKQIFCRMCAMHSDAGATFMSLYTGENNPARHVYEAAGCRPAVRWSNLRLELK